MPAAEVGEPFSWKVEAREGEWLRVALRGEFDENADFSELRATQPHSASAAASHPKLSGCGQTQRRL